MYNSCRDRHCPQCQRLEAAQWAEARASRMLDVPHFQIVFTIPAELRPLARRNPAFVYGLLFASAACILRTLGEQRLKATLGVTAVLHTWKSDLGYHPHVHCMVTGGGLSEDGKRWARSRSKWLFPQKVMGSMLRGKTMEGVIAALDAGELDLGAEDTETEARLRRFLRSRKRRDKRRWVVHVEPPKGRRAGAITHYLARYVKRVAISDQRIVSVDDEGVAFRTKTGQLRLSGADFVRRFSQHILPKGFRKVRHYGLYAPGSAGQKLDKARSLIPPISQTTTPTNTETSAAMAKRTTKCPECGSLSVTRLMLFTARFASQRPAPTRRRPTALPRGPP